MVSITLSVPEDVKCRMDKFSEINWSGFVRGAIVEKTSELSWKEDMLKKLEHDKEFEGWCVEMGRKVKKGRFKKLRAKGLV